MVSSLIIGVKGEGFVSIRTLEAEHVARDKILRGIRSTVDDDFLIMVNANEDKIPRWAEYVNGTYRETFPTLEIPFSEITDLDKQYRTLGYSRESLPKIEEAIIWSENHLREPHINGLTGLGIEGEPPDSPTKSAVDAYFYDAEFNTFRWLCGI